MKKERRRITVGLSSDYRSAEDGPELSDAAPTFPTPYPFNSGQPGKTPHIFEIPSLLSGGKPPSFPATILYTVLYAILYT